MVLQNLSFKTTLKAQLKQSQKRNGASGHLKENMTGRGMFVVVAVVLGGGGGEVRWTVLKGQVQG